MDSACVAAIATCVAATANIVIAAGVLLAKRQLELSRETVNKDHERSRLMLSLEMCREWNRAVDSEVDSARKLISSLDTRKCRQIAKSSSDSNEAMEIPQEDFLSFVKNCLTGSPSEPPLFEEDGGNILITAAGVNRLRHLGVKYLNELEIALSAWMKGVGDQDYLAHQFSFLDTDPSQVMHSFRTAIEGGTTPAINAFLSRDTKGADPQTKIGQDS